MTNPDEPTVRIAWQLDRFTPARGVTGIDAEHVPVSELVRWAKRRRRELRRAIRELSDETKESRR